VRRLGKIEGKSNTINKKNYKLWETILRMLRVGFVGLNLKLSLTKFLGILDLCLEFLQKTYFRKVMQGVQLKVLWEI